MWAPVVIGDVIVDLIDTIAVEPVAAITLSGAVEPADVHRRDTYFARRERTIAIRQDIKSLDADAFQREVGVGARVEAVIAGLGDSEASLIDDRRREQVKPLGREIVVSRLDQIAECRIIRDAEPIRDVGGVPREDFVVLGERVIDLDEVLIVVNRVRSRIAEVDAADRVGKTYSARAGCSQAAPWP